MPLPRLSRVPRFFFAATLLTLALPALATDPATNCPQEDGRAVGAALSAETAAAAHYDALWAGIEFGARVDATLRVGIDDPATPAAGARAAWEGARSAAERLDPAVLPSGTAGADGALRLRGLCFDGYDCLSSAYPFPAEVRVTAPGAWGRRFPLAVGAPTGGVWRVTPRPGEAVAADGTLLLRGVRRPAPLALSELAVACEGFPAEAVGYDAAKGAFLPPLGDGETADFLVEAGLTAAMPNQPSYAWLVLRPAPGGALLLERDRWDDLRTPREAPENGWSAEPARFVFRNHAHEIGPRFRPLRGLYARLADIPGPNETPLGRVILFRSRPDGCAAASGPRFRHGAVVPPRFFALSDANVFDVRFNPGPGDRSLEPLSGLPPLPPTPDAGPAAPTPAGPLGEGPLLAALASDGETALFLGAEAEGAFAPPTFPAAVRFAPGGAGATPLAAVRTLVVPDFVKRIPARAFAGLPELRCVAVASPSGASVGPGAFADCHRLEAALFRDPPRNPLPADAFAGAAPGFAAFIGYRPGLGPETGDETALPRAGGAPPLPARVVGFRDEDGWTLPFSGIRWWSLGAGRADYRGPRADGGVLWMPLAGGGAAILHRAEAAGPSPAALGGRPVVDEAALRRRLPPLRWKWPAPGEAAVAGFFAPAMPDAFDGPIEVPAALPSGARVVAIADGAFSPLSPDPRDDPAAFAGRNDAWWRSNSVDLVVPEGVRSIGARAFAGFAPLRSVRLPTTLETIGPEAFADCIALERIELPNAVREIPVGAFKGCRALRLASAPGALRVGPFAFAACPVLAAVRLAPGAEIDPWAFRDSPHAESAESESHAESAETAEP